MTNSVMTRESPATLALDRTLPSVVFLDRDGTVIRDTEYLSDPAHVELIDGVAESIVALNQARVPVIIVTNQSGIGRGLYTEASYYDVARKLDALLAERGASVLATYFCPHAPESGCECRKPGTQLFRQAAQAYHLDLSRALFIGDRWRDIAPALEFGGTGTLVPSGTTPPDDVAQALAHATIASTIAEALPHGLQPSYNRRMTARIAVLASGGGTNLQAILDHFAAMGAARSGDVVVVASNRADAYALERARRAGIPARHLADTSADSLLRLFDDYQVDLIALAGYLKLIPAEVTQRYPGRMVNVHPGPLPAFGGPGMYGQRVHAAVLASGVQYTGVTVHFVDDQYDHGAVLAHWPVPVKPADTPETLAARVLAVEHVLYPRLLDALAATIDREITR